MYIVLSTSTVFNIIHDAFIRVYRKLKRLDQRIKRPEELDRITIMSLSH